MIAKGFANRNNADKEESIILKINSFSDRFKRFINRDKAFDIILILLGLCFNSMRKRYKYSKIRVTIER